MKRIFGPITGIAVGTVFQNRQELADSGIHRPLQAGISGSGQEGADSIVVSGGYEDDSDEGNEIIYTGHGGNDPATKKQVADQELTRQNLALAQSHENNLPVRVVRGAKLRSAFSPVQGYRYDGLYYVERYWSEPGKSGFLVWRFKLSRDKSTPLPPRRSLR
jgi:putative restriction endonuclease